MHIIKIDYISFDIINIYKNSKSNDERLHIEIDNTL